jgi:hypothetical protein
MRTCTRCSEEKDLELFAKGAKYKEGRRNVCKACHAAYMARYFEDNPDQKQAVLVRQRKNYRNWKKHKLSEESYLELFNKFNGKCHSCQENDSISLDHDHSCCDGALSCGSCVRGILCHNCNTALGLLKDSPERVQKLLEYISSKG